MNRNDLYKYQEYCIEFILRNLACGLLLEMGLGKSVIALTAIAKLLVDGIGKVLIIAPLRVARDTWSNECEKWDHLKHLRISKILGNREERLRAIETDADIYVINRENVPWLVEHFKKDFPYEMVVIDELSSFKSGSSMRFKALKKVRPRIKRIVGLTGTPAPNNLEDLWSQIYLLDRGERLGRYISNYRNEYFVPDKRSQNVIFTYKPRENAEAEIYKKLSDICVSMKACDYLEMPERIDNFVDVSLSEKELKLYKKLEREMLLPFKDGDVTAVNAATLAGKLLQMANGAVYDENKSVKVIHDKKLEALEDLIESANGKPVLVFYGYKHDKNRLKEHFGDNAREILTSDDFVKWNEGKINIAITHPASTGHGLNLQAGGSTIIWFGLTWSLELYQQANARLWRQGQTDTVVVHHIVAKDTIDEQVINAIKTKDCGQQVLMEAVKARIGGI